MKYFKLKVSSQPVSTDEYFDSPLEKMKKNQP